MSRGNSFKGQPGQGIDPRLLAGMGAMDVPVIDPNREVFKPFVQGGEVARKEFTPLGCMIVAQVVQDSRGNKADGIVIPDTVKSWGTNIMAVVAVGPDCKWLKRGDWVLVSRDVVPQVIRYRDVESLFLHEQQCFAFIDEVRERNEAAENKSDGEVAHDRDPHTS